MTENPSPLPNDNDDKQFYVRGLRYGGVATEFVAITLILGYVGHRLDEKYGWASWGLLGGLLVGMGLGLWVMIKQLEKLNR